MSKLTIFLCTLIFTSAANARVLNNRLLLIQNKIDGIISYATSVVSSEFKAAEQKSNDNLAKLEDAAVKYTKRIADQVSAIVEKSRNKVKNITDQAKDVDVTECTKWVKELDDSASSLSSNIDKCVVGKTKTATGYINDMRKLTDAVLNTFETLRKEGTRCRQELTIHAIFCSKSVVARAKWTSAKTVPSYSIHLAKLAYLQTTVTPSLSQCTSPNDFDALDRQSSKIIKRIEKCVIQKIEAANRRRPSTAAPVPTTTVVTEPPVTTVSTQTPAPHTMADDLPTIITQTTPAPHTMADDLPTVISQTTPAPHTLADDLPTVISQTTPAPHTLADDLPTVISQTTPAPHTLADDLPTVISQTTPAPHTLADDLPTVISQTTPAPHTLADDLPTVISQTTPAPHTLADELPTVITIMTPAP